MVLFTANRIRNIKKKKERVWRSINISVYFKCYRDDWKDRKDGCKMKAIDRKCFRRESFKNHSYVCVYTNSSVFCPKIFLLYVFVTTHGRIHFYGREMTSTSSRKTRRVVPFVIPATMHIALRVEKKYTDRSVKSSWGKKPIQPKLFRIAVSYRVDCHDDGGVNV